MTKPTQRYVPLSKVEDQSDGTIKVWGWCSSEAMDADGDIIKADAMAAAMPEFMKYGNIREMHGNVAAGVAFEWEGLPDGKTWLGAHIVDDGSIKKVKKGVLKGFSIGGNGTATDPENPKIITALTLNEISLVDRPANPDAVINLWKAKNMTTPTVPEETQAKKTKESGSAGAEGNQPSSTPEPDAQQPTSGATKAAQHKTMQDADGDAANNEKEAAIDSGVENLPKAKAADHAGDCTCEACSGMSKAAKITTDAAEAQKDADADEHGEMQEKFTKASEKAEPYGDVEYADPGYQADGKKRYPVDTETHIRAAWSYINKPHNASEYSAGEVSKIKSRIVAAWKKKIDPKGPPSAKEKSMSVGNVEKAASVNPGNGTAAAYPKKGDAVVLKDGEFTHQAKINEIKDGVASVDSENFEVTVSVAALGEDDAEASEGSVKWVTTMDQAHNWTFKQSNKEHIDSGVAPYSNAGAKTASAKGGSLLKRYVEKGMYDIVDFAYILSSLNSLVGCMKFEEAAEDDDEGSKAFAALKAWAEAGKHVMMAIVTEELGEMGTAEDLDVMDVLMEKAAGSKLLQKGLGVFLESAGTEVIAEMHEFCAVKLAEAAPGNALQKALKSGDQTELVKALTAQNQTVLDALEQASLRIAKLEAQPLGGPMLKGSGIEGQSGKEADITNGAGAVAPVVMPGTGNEDKAATAFKKSFKSGGQNLFNLTK